MLKSPDAFRTISEVAEDLDLPQHVLRFWETRFPQVRPLKRAGGRRYYRPADVLLLRSIRQLLYDDGYTIKGVQRLLKEQGPRSIRGGEPGASGMGPAIVGEVGTGAVVEVDAADIGPFDLDPPADDRIDAAPGAVEIAADPLQRLQRDVARSAISDAAEPHRPHDRDALREALSIVEECAAILRAARQDRS